MMKPHGPKSATPVAMHVPCAGPNLEVVFLGQDLLAWLVLALGGALAVGNFGALVRPPESKRGDTDLDHAPLARTLIMGGVGLVAALWALATLVS